jgi:hypothetical protein
MIGLSDQFYIDCVQALLAILKIKLYTVVFLYLIDQSAGVHEGFFIAVVVLDKAKALVCIKEFYGACCFVVHH